MGLRGLHRGIRITPGIYSMIDKITESVSSNPMNAALLIGEWPSTQQAACTTDLAADMSELGKTVERAAFRCLEGMLNETAIDRIRALCAAQNDCHAI